MLAEEACELLNSALNVDSPALMLLFSNHVPASVSLGQSTPLAVTVDQHSCWLSAIGVVNALIDDRDKYVIEFSPRRAQYFQVKELIQNEAI